MYRVRKIQLILSMLLLSFIEVSSVEKVTFSGGEPLTNFQPSLIIPILTEAFKRNGIEFNAVYYPSLRSLAESNSGKIDGELHRIYDFQKVSGGKYPNLIRIESEMLKVHTGIFSKKDIEIDSLSDLKGYKVVYYRGRKKEQMMLKNALPEENIFEAKSDHHAFLMLATNRVDFVFTEVRQGESIVNEDERFSDIKLVQKIGATRIFSYINRRHKELAPTIATTIEEMKKDGTFDTITQEILLK